MPPTAAGQSMIWCTNKKGKFSLFFRQQEPWLLLGIMTHLFIFRKKWMLSMGEAQASDLLLGALMKGLS